MTTKTFRNLEDLESYYDKKTDTYDLTYFDLVIFKFDFMINADIRANNIKVMNINAANIKASNITAWKIKTWDIEARNIDAMNINARNISAGNINAWDIKANNIYALDINALDIEARNISYYAFCIAYKNIKCKSIKGRRENCKHFALDGVVEVEEDE